MGTTKADLFSKEQNEIANLARALGHPARIAILQVLLKQSACYCGNLVEELGLAQATISQHLKELKTAGLIRGSIEGINISYCIDTKNWKAYRQVFQTLFKEIDSPENCC